MNSLVCIGVPTTSGGQGAMGQGGSKLKLAPLTLRSLPSIQSRSCHSQLTRPHFQMPMNSLVCIGVPTTSGVKGLGGNMGASWSWFPSFPNPCCHSPHSQLAGPHSQMPVNSLVCIWVPTTSWAQGARGQHGSKLKLAPLTPRWLPSLPSPCCHSPHSQLPAPSSSLPACSSSLPMAMYVLGSPPPVGCKGLWGKVGVSWSKLGSWSELEQTGTELERAGASQVNGTLY